MSPWMVWEWWGAGSSLTDDGRKTGLYELVTVRQPPPDAWFHGIRVISIAGEIVVIMETSSVTSGKGLSNLCVANYRYVVEHKEWGQ